MEELQKRLDAEYAAYMDRLKGRTPEELMDMAYELAATERAYRGLDGAVLRNYGDVLSRFREPLALVRDLLLEQDATDHAGALDYALWTVRDRQEDFQMDYGMTESAAEGTHIDGTPVKKRRREER